MLELALVLVSIVVLIGVAGTRFFELQATAEQTAVKSTLATLNSALGMRVAQYQARQDWRGLAALTGSNPVDNLERPPKFYRAGNQDAMQVKPGEWYFDRREGVLVYRVRNGERLRGGLQGPTRLRFAIRPVFDDRNRNDRYDPGVDHIETVRLVALEPYWWTN